MIHYVSLLTSTALSVLLTISVVVSKFTVQMCGNTDCYVLDQQQQQQQQQHQRLFHDGKPIWKLHWIPPKHLRLDTYSYPAEESSSV